MVPDSPAEALGSNASMVRDDVIDVVRKRHGYAADAHQAAHARNTRGYSTLWQDLLVDIQERFQKQGHSLHRLAPAGHRVPIVNGCILYVWRVPASSDPVNFATSPTKMSCFDATLPDPALFGLDFMGMPGTETEDLVAQSEQDDELETVMSSVEGTMPVVLVMVHSSPWQLQSIEWAVAEFDRASGEISFRGQETIWQPELVAEPGISEVESFDSGAPIGPVLEPREQERPKFDA
ncbi:hypothetical protein CIK76_13120 [Glutamicibacter sp. BW80]|uniref:hypothetical protein n=1 Tax=Glutamicibacter sp. BW80 TaxID=2024404 RepID=UPI000BB8D385|nr:hypothetical protein [Glutamicibacter sp. BW80]PCC28195.1 hypothetical protein CIK76_13120 [Glutamicibacter sp. BW80]